jgi:hypothetical protein
VIVAACAGASTVGAATPKVGTASALPASTGWKFKNLFIAGINCFFNNIKKFILKN